MSIHREKDTGRDTKILKTVVNSWKERSQWSWGGAHLKLNP